MFNEKLYNAWLESENVTEDIKIKLRNMNDQEKALSFSNAKLKFGTAGFRTLIAPGNQFLNTFTYSQLIFGYAKFLKENSDVKDNLRVVIGTDNRRNYKEYLKLAIRILTSENIKVYVDKDLEPIPTPMISYLVNRYKAAGAINITASHNPKEYNGIKFYNNLGSQLLPEEDEQVIENMCDPFLVLNYNPVANEELVEKFSEEDVSSYFNKIKENLKFSDNVNFKKPILFSSMHGAATKYMKSFLESCGYNIINFEPQCTINSEFSNTTCINPELELAFKELKQYADQNNIEYIFATDPDADRLGVMFKKDNKWEILSGNQAGIIESYFLLEKFKKTNTDEKLKPYIISTFVSNNLIDKIIKQYDGEVLRTATGFKWIANKLNKFNDKQYYINGFEEAIGALPSRINKDKDSFQVALLLLEILNFYNEQNYDFFDILEKVIYPKFGHLYSNTVSIEIKELNWKEITKNYLSLLSNINTKTILNRSIIEIKFNEEGNCLEFILENDSWIKFRTSGTEPKFKIYFNLYSKEQIKAYNPKIIQELEDESNEILELLEQYLEINQ